MKIALTLSILCLGISQVSAEVGIYLSKSSPKLINSGSYYRSSSESYKSSQKSIKFKGLFQYTIIDFDTGQTMRMYCSALPYRLFFLDFPGRRNEYFYPSGSSYINYGEYTSNHQSFVNSSGKGALLYSSSNLRYGNVDSSGGDETVQNYISVTSGKISPLKVTTPTKLKMTLDDIPKTMNISSGVVTSRAVAYRISGFYSVSVRSGSTHSHDFRTARLRLDKKLTAAANDPLAFAIGGTFPGSFEYAVHIIEGALQEAGYGELPISADSENHVYWLN